MALTLSSSVARWTGANNASGATFVSGSFTPAHESLIVCFVEADTQGADGAGVTYDVTGGGLTWTRQVERRDLETTAGGHSGIWTAPVTVGASMTATITRNGGATGAVSGRVTGRALVWTGYDVATPVETVGANNEGGSATNDLTTTALTPTVDGVLCAASADWNALGTFDASANLTQDTAHYAGAVSVCDGYVACTASVSVSANLNANGASAAQHKWCQILVRAAAAATGASAIHMRPNGFA